MTVREALSKAIQNFQDGGDTPREAKRKAQLLMSHVLDIQTASLIVRETDVLSGEHAARFDEFVARAETESVHRIIGWREFHGLRFALSPATLEPRDDTETLINLALSQLRDRKRPWRFADLGTGTGAVALALLQELPNATALATDIDPDALSTAIGNAQTNGFSDRFETACGNWFEAISEPFDFIVSNPPYIPSATIETLHPNVRDQDPLAALDGGEDGLQAYRTIMAGAALYLEDSGFLALEIGHDQAGQVSALALAESFTTTSVRRDLTGNNRALLVSR